MRRGLEPGTDGGRLANEGDNVKDDDDDGSEGRRLCNRISTTLRK